MRFHTKHHISLANTQIFEFLSYFHAVLFTVRTFQQLTEQRSYSVVNDDLIVYVALSKT